MQGLFQSPPLENPAQKTYIYSPMSFPFNIRVYGLLINDRKEVLVTDEWRNGMAMTKFPGGGLEFGEGTIDCLKREFQEELSIAIQVKAHFYTTDFFQASAFNAKHQLISIYYLIESKGAENIPTVPAAQAFTTKKEGEQLFRWLSLAHLSAKELTFPVDKIVAEKLSAL
jgi:8-oxo-dGTP diphosphatase